VGDGGDEVSVARCIADQRTFYRVPHTITCARLGVSLVVVLPVVRPDANAERASAQRVGRRGRGRRQEGARAARLAPAARRSARGRLDDGGEETVADSMLRQGLVARRIRRRGGLARADKSAPRFPDLLRWDFTASAPNGTWVGDMTQIPTAAGKLYLATVLDLYSRRLLGAATGLHPDAELACAAIKMAIAARGGAEAIGGVIFPLITAG
jgi:putative transposase